MPISEVQPQFSAAAHAPNYLQRHAQKAIKQNAVLDFSPAGMPILKGKNWRGRAALWFKDRLIPGHRRQRRMRVMRALAHATKIVHSEEAARLRPKKPLFARKAEQTETGISVYAPLRATLLQAARL